MMRPRSDLSPTEVQSWSSPGPPIWSTPGFPTGAVCALVDDLGTTSRSTGIPRRPPVRPSVDGCARYAAAVPRRLANTPRSNRGCASI
jgi:hypothetical protein